LFEEDIKTALNTIAMTAVGRLCSQEGLVILERFAPQTME
jgi:hypothetical protein